MATTYVPVIMGGTISPNPAKVGQTVLISGAAADVALVSSTFIPTSGEFTSGEI